MTKLLEQKPDDSGSQSDDAQMPDDVIQELLIQEWLYCFQKNDVYKTYCEAKRKGISEDEICATLQLAHTEHTRIAKLYQDWDDIHVLPSMNDDDAWVEWFTAKQHLFKLTKVEVVELDDWLEQPENTTLIAIPNGLKKEILLQIFHEFVCSHPEITGDLPRYEVRRINTKSWDETLKKVQRAKFVYEWHSATNDDKASYVEIVETVLRSPEVNRYFGFNWSIENDIDRVRFERGELGSQALEDYRQEAMALKKFYEDCIDYTIRGIFPAIMKG